MQQHLPFTVLKLKSLVFFVTFFAAVATALTVYGIETFQYLCFCNIRKHRVATALTVYGIETRPMFIATETDYKLQQHLPFTVLKPILSCSFLISFLFFKVATALTVYGIETYMKFDRSLLNDDTLQQHLPFTVLKPGLLFG